MNKISWIIIPVSHQSYILLCLTACCHRKNRKLWPRCRHPDHYFLRGAFGKLIYTQQLGVSGIPANPLRREGQKAGARGGQRVRRCTRGRNAHVCNKNNPEKHAARSLVRRRIWNCVGQVGGSIFFFPLGGPWTVPGAWWEKRTTGRCAQSICPCSYFRGDDCRTALKVHPGSRNNICRDASPERNLREQWE